MAAAEADGRVLIGGDFTIAQGSTTLSNFARLYADGSLDTTFGIGTGPDLDVYSLALQKDGTAVIAGDFNNVNGVPRPHLAKLNSDGTLNSTFNPRSGIMNDDPQISADVLTSTLQSDGKLLIGGDFAYINGVCLAELWPDLTRTVRWTLASIPASTPEAL